MLVNSAVLAAALAVLDGVSASAIKRQVLKDENVGNRIQGEAKIGDKCHPPGTYELGGSKIIPPCLSEQAIALKCEKVTHLASDPSEKNRRAYGECLAGRGSSYFRDVQGCLSCKKSHGHLSEKQYDWYSKRWAEGREAFIKDDVPKTNVWDGYVQAAIGGSKCQHGNETLYGWACWDKLPKGPGETDETVPIEEYYTDRLETQNIGSFDLDGKKYPESTTMEVELKEFTFEITGHLGYYSSAKLEDGTLTVEGHAELKVQTVTEYREIKSICNFTTPDVFTIVSAISPAVPLKDSVATVPEKEASTLPTINCDGSCIASSLSIKELEVVVIQGSKKVDEVVAEAATPALNELKQNKSVSHEAEITILKQVNVLFTNIKKYPTPSEVSPPATPSEASSPATSKNPCVTRRRR
ncbi:hypothetical protein X797_012243 [Metarhizium robertsii]|uniref:Uncharacterized protein n=1 Tax=Metarhizium robertsii TaxID=568076 RepID=A0A014PGK3_9HYPO|nr:hypothetical protein X797_012243 [Metarhizium robertsii]